MLHRTAHRKIVKNYASPYRLLSLHPIQLSSSPPNPRFSPMSSQIPTKKHNSHKPSPSSSSFQRKKPRWQSQAPNPNTEFSNPVEIPPISYGFDDLEQRSLVLFDGTIKSYYALPPNYPMGPAVPCRPQDEDYWSYLGLDDKPGLLTEQHLGKKDDLDWLRECVRRYGNPNANSNANPNGKVGLEGSESGATNDDGFASHRESVRRYGNPNASLEREAKEMEDGHVSLRGSVRKYENPNADNWFENPERVPRGESVKRYGNLDVESQSENKGRELRKMEGEDNALNEAFLRCAKMINESLAERMTYLEDGKNKPLRCIICGRTSRVFSGVHDLVVHAYTSKIAELRIDHLGLHKALCVLMGWDYATAPDASKAYQSLSAHKAAANREDLIVWPPTVIVHNTSTARKKDGRMGGLSDKEVEVKLKELGFTGGTSKSLYGKGGHLGIAAVKFSITLAGLKEAERLAEYFKKDNRGRERWAKIRTSQTNDDEKNPALIEVDKKTDENNNILCGYLATASDLENVDVDTRKKAIIKSRKEFDPQV